jgi:hypothetical protein
MQSNTLILLEAKFLTFFLNATVISKAPVVEDGHEYHRLSSHNKDKNQYHT